MKKSTRVILSITFILLLVFFTSDSFAQCAMCKANAESSLRNGSSVVKGLNTGILYLMLIPYLLLAFIFRAQLKTLFGRMKARFTSR